MVGFSRDGGQPRRIDGMWADSKRAGTLCAVELVEGHSLPGHRVVQYSVNLERAHQKVVKMAKVQCIKVCPMEREQEGLLVERMLEPHSQRWEELVQAREVDGMWELWTWLAEEVGLALSCPELEGPDDLRAGEPLPHAPAALHRGRGTDQMLRSVNLCPEKCTERGEPKTRMLFQILAIMVNVRTCVQ